MKTEKAKTLVLGLGNPILTDDGAGIRVAEELEKRLDKREVTVQGASVAGLDLLEILADYDRAIIVDSIQTGDGKVGQIYRLEPDAFFGTYHTTTPHDVNFATALELGKKLSLPIPRQIIIFAIEVADVISFGEKCTPAVVEAIPACVTLIIKELEVDSIALSENRILSRSITG